MSDQEAFRLEVREWLEANCPKAMREPILDPAEVAWSSKSLTFTSPEQEQWFNTMRDKGWFCPDWPVEFGGGGLDRVHHNILKDELRRINARPPQASLGVWMAGPAILEYGTQEQKEFFLPEITQGRVRWCQGYSEPGAGSDLAGLKCKAELDGDDFVINGSKIWTSYADDADWMFCLVRTDFDAPKREGITFILLDMKTPGIKVETITMTNGDKHFCQVFFDDVRVPASQVLSEVNKGWTVAKRVLEFERAMISELDDVAARPEDSPIDLAKKYIGLNADGKLSDAVIRDKISQHLMNAQAFDLTMQRGQEEIVKKDLLAGMALVIAKYQGTEEAKRKYKLLTDILGFNGIAWSGDDYSEEELRIPKDLLNTYAHTVAGGTSEVQLNIIAKRVLGLPD
ncbi:MAG: acyl-CoA dehydrogenase family protein [Pseudomonadota bacterium]